MTLSMFERTRETGLLRAAGLDRAATRWMIRGEARMSRYLPRCRRSRQRVWSRQPLGISAVFGDGEDVRVVVGGTDCDGVAADCDALAVGEQRIILEVEDGIGVVGRSDHSDGHLSARAGGVNDVHEHTTAGQGGESRRGTARVAVLVPGVVAASPAAFYDDDFRLREWDGDHGGSHAWSGDWPKGHGLLGFETGEAADLAGLEPTELPSAPRQHLPGLQVICVGSVATPIRTMDLIG